MKFMEKESKNTWNLGLELRKREKLAKCQKDGFRHLEVMRASKEG